MTALLDQAMAAHRQGRLDEAVRLYRRVLAARPENAAAHTQLGSALNSLGQAEEALAAFNRALALDPRQPIAWLNRGGALEQLRRLDEALASIDRALALNPGHGLGWFRRGGVLQMLLRHEEAVVSYDRALALAPQVFEAWNNRGQALQQLGRLDAAMDSFRRAEAISPQPLTRLNMGLLYLLRQDFARGLPLYEERKRLAPPIEARDYPQPLWTGREDIAGKTLFAYIEQGLGDTIQYYRYVRFALERGAHVILSVPDMLLALLSSAAPQVELIGWQQVPPQFDFHIPLASLPLAAGMTAAFSPGKYLSADPARVVAWREKLGDRGLRIAIAWQGNEAVPGAEGKSFPLAALAPIAAIPGARLISVQKGPGSEQRDTLPSGMAVEGYDFDDGPDAFLDTAAILEACDLGIMADTGAAHLAGALGRPCWMALKYVPDWRWFMRRADTPWYESLRLYRQPSPGDWAGVFTAMAQDLRAGRAMSICGS